MRFFVLMAVFAFVLCGVTAFYTKRAEHGRSNDERAGYWVGKKVGEESAPDAHLPNAAALNMMAQDYFKRQGSGGDQSDWDLGFEHGFEDGFNSTHPKP